MKLKHAFLVAILLIGSTHLHAQNIDISFTGIRSAKGQLIVKVFTDQKSFEYSKELKAIKFDKVKLLNGQTAGSLNLEPGTYGMALLDDENSDGVMEYNIIHLPKEGFGFSNFYLTGMKKPKFEQFKFTVIKDQRLKINIKARYL